MKATKIFAIFAMVLLVAMPMQAQKLKDKKAAKKEAWDARQQFIKDSTAIANQQRLDDMRNAKKIADEKAAKEDAERRQREAEEKAQREKEQKRKDLQETSFDEPCTEYESTAEMLRGRGIGEDLDHQFSVDIARTAALENLSSQISTNIKGLLTRNRKQMKNGGNRQSLQKTEDMVVTEIEQTTGYRIACKETRTFYEDDVRVFKTYMVVEISADEVLKNLHNKLQKDEDIKLDMNFDEFKKDFNQHFQQQL